MTNALYPWVGNKSKMLDRLLPLFEGDFDCYVEPFLGSAVVAAHVPIQTKYLSDVNADLIAFWQEYSRNAEGLASALSSLEKLSARVVYNALRGLETKGTDVSLRAARFLMIARRAFSGLWRENKRGSVNSAFGEGCSIHLPACPSSLTEANFSSCPFDKAIENVDIGPKTLVYLDPPYLSKDAKAFTNYSSHCWTDAEYIHLGKLANSAVDAGAKVVVSHSDHPLNAVLFPEDRWTHQHLTLSTPLAKHLKAASSRVEVIIWSNPNGRT